MARNGTALVLGATGGIGGEVARALRARGWNVRALRRQTSLPAGADIDGVAWVRGDAMNARDVAAAADGASLIVHAVNPPGYRRWDELVLPMLDSTIAAARASGARVVLPGNVYNYGPDAGACPDETAPQHPRTRKGRVRVEMERRLQTANVPVLIVRAGDFFGPGALNNWFSQVLVKAGRRPTAITYPGRPGVGHLWAYLPDLAETIVRLVERGDALEAVASFHLGGHWDADGTRMIAAIRRAVGEPALPVRAMPWGLMALASPFVPLFRELREMRYLWEVPLRLDNARLVATLGEEPHTPLDEAVRTTLVGLGCLGANDGPNARCPARPVATASPGSGAA